MVFESINSDISAERERSDGFRELCAHYGFVMYLVQSLEHGVAHANHYLDLAMGLKKAISEAGDDRAPAKEAFDVDLGRLLKRLQGITHVPAALIHTLGQARYRRDLLIHRFFRDRSESFFHGKSGALLDELRGHRIFFCSANKSLKEFIRPVLLCFGFTEESVQSDMDAYLAQPGSRVFH
jgi:hypothetical protein